MEVHNSKPGTRTNFFPFAHKLEVKMCAQKLVFSILIHCWLNQACEYFFQSRNSVFSLSLCHWLKCFSLSCVITVESYCANKITISHLVCKNAVSMPLNGRPEIYMPFSEFITKRNGIWLAQIFSPINIWQFPWNNSSPIISFYAEPNRHTDGNSRPKFLVVAIDCVWLLRPNFQTECLIDFSYHPFVSFY